MDMIHMSASPHIRSYKTTSSIMLDVIIALIPATLFGIYQFGFDALLVVSTCIISSVLSEYFFEKLLHRTITIYDYSAVVTGLLLALTLSPKVPLWMCALGSCFAIVVVKQIYGGIGQNFMNPALAARCFLLISFAGKMTDFAVDGFSSATPLVILKKEGSFDLLTSFLGKTGGSIGETSTLLILVGFAYLLYKRVISWEIPVAYIGSVFVGSLFFAKWYLPDAVAQLLNGGLMLGACFMATDYTTSPITFTGRIIFGVLLGFLTCIFRFFGGSAEGVSYAIILGNLLVPMIEKYTLPTPFGKERKHV